MRYAKGSVHLSQSQDYPLLRQVLRSETATQSQLYDFMRLRHQEWSRRSFDWRLRRLVCHQLVHRYSLPSFRGDLVCSIAPSGAAVLQGLGEYCLFSPNRGDAKNQQGSVLHALELNDLHLSLLRVEPTVRWTYATDIRSQNELTRLGYAKDYDAVIILGCRSQDVRLALEYERTPKAAKHYDDIAASLGREVQIDCLLYVMPNYDLLNFVSGFFAHAKLPVYFGLARDWHVHFLQMPVVDPSSHSLITLSDVLKNAVRTPQMKLLRG